MKKFEVKGHEYSILPCDKEWNLVWSDEFDGTELDRTKWGFRTSMMGQKHPAWVEDGVEIDGKSNLVFKCIEHNGQPVSAQLQTGYNFMDEPVEKTKFCEDHLQWNIGKLKENKFVHKFGYYECRCKLQQKYGWWSAFWMQSPVIGSSMNSEDSGSEIDIMECFDKGEIASHNVFTGGYGLDMKRARVGGIKDIDPTEFHRFGLLWDKNGYTFYIDGVEDGHISEYVSKRPEFILISTEVKGYRHEDHKPTKEAYESIGDEFIVDYIRVFETK